MKKIIGQFGVDSGTIMIVDPCYFNDPMRWNPKKLLGFAKEHDAKGETRMAENTRRLAKEKQELQNIIGNWDQVCKDTEKLPKNYASGVITHTRDGDGLYDVIGHYDEAGEITKIEIKF